MGFIVVSLLVLENEGGRRVCNSHTWQVMILYIIIILLFPLSWKKESGVVSYSYCITLYYCCSWTYVKRVLKSSGLKGYLSSTLVKCWSSHLLSCGFKSAPVKLVVTTIIYFIPSWLLLPSRPISHVFSRPLEQVEWITRSRECYISQCIKESASRGLYW